MLDTIINLLKQLFGQNIETTKPEVKSEKVVTKPRTNDVEVSHMYDGANTLGNSTQQVSFGSDPGFAPYVPEVDDVLAASSLMDFDEIEFEMMDGETVGTDLTFLIESENGFDWEDDANLAAQLSSCNLNLEGENVNLHTDLNLDNVDELYFNHDDATSFEANIPDLLNFEVELGDAIPVDYTVEEKAVPLDSEVIFPELDTDYSDDVDTTD